MRSFPRRLSIRVMMLLIVLLSCGLGWVVHRARVKRRAVQAILARGGLVEFDYQYDTRRDRRNSRGESWWPEWLRRSLGDEYFHDVVCVGMERNPTDADLALLEDLGHVRLLYLGSGGGRITDDGLRHLGKLTDLRMLILWGNPITGDGLEHLRDLKQLRHLDLSSTRIEDDRLSGLRGLTALERIDFPNNPRLTGAFFEHVADLPNLKSVVVRGCGITDVGLSHLKDARGVQDLMLDNTRVSDAGLPNLRGLPIRAMDLSSTNVSDEGLNRVCDWFPNAVVTPRVSDGSLIP
jgi:hypothetical protein